MHLIKNPVPVRKRYTFDDFLIGVWPAHHPVHLTYLQGQVVLEKYQVWVSSLSWGFVQIIALEHLLVNRRLREEWVTVTEMACSLPMRLRLPGAVFRERYLLLNDFPEVLRRGRVSASETCYRIYPGEAELATQALAARTSYTHHFTGLPPRDRLRLVPSRPSPSS